MKSSDHPLQSIIRLAVTAHDFSNIPALEQYLKENTYYDFTKIISEVIKARTTERILFVYRHGVWAWRWMEEQNG